MPTKHLYVSADELTLWQEAADLAASERRSLSWIIHDALRLYLRLAEEKRRATS